MFEKKQSQFLESFEHLALDYILVHSNAMKTMPLIKISSDKNSLLNSHIQLLQKIVANDKLLIPTFSYQFPKTRHFDLVNTPSEVGHISEFYRQNFATWRSHDPMFSFAGAGKSLVTESQMQCPFDQDSIFSQLAKTNGYVLFYGADFSSATIIHYVEYLANIEYRYWKSFEGKIRNGDQTKKIIFKSHFRPMGKYLEYDWVKLKSDLINEKILNTHFSNVVGFHAKKLVEFWLSKLKEDPLYLLDNKSKQWITPILEQLGRGFVQNDFEELIEWN